MSFPDADAFVALAKTSGLFAPEQEIAVARAPGRLDLMGGIADYSGSLVLEWPIAAAALAAAQQSGDGRVVAVSGERRVDLSVPELVGVPVEELAQRFSGQDRWAAYALGPAAVLAAEERASPSGLRLLVSSDIPEGKGVASSAAVEVACGQAAAASFGWTVEPRRLALLAQRAEQQVARAPCGAMDQLTAACGEQGKLLAILCRPAEVVDSIALPPGLALWGIESVVAHAVGGGAYGRVRCAAFMGKALLGCEGHLTTLDPSEVDGASLPEQQSGAEFLSRHAGVEDDVSTVEPDVVYPVRAATLHPIEEHLRVRLFAELLGEQMTDECARLLGELMYQSHASYSRCGLGTAGTDAIVAGVREFGWDRGLVGAKTSGGGSGGTVVVLGRENAEPLVCSLAAELGAGIVAGSSDGAAAFGTRLLHPQ